MTGFIGFPMLWGRLMLSVAWLSLLVSSDSIPIPISVSANKDFDGIDGNWSTFAIRVGNPAQNFRVLASTLVPETWVVRTEGCTTNSPADCQNARGNLYMPSASKTWSDQKTWSVGIEVDLGYNEKNAGNFGYDTLGVSTPTGGVVLDHQNILGIATTDFYLGYIGLAARTPAFNGNQNPSFLATLKSQSRIPSLSYSYTAGAHYNSTLGSLTLGGVDTSRFVPNNVMFQFGPSDTQYLSVGVQSIAFTSGDDTKELADNGFYAIIDSTISELWLPNATCTLFADAYGLEFDSLKLKYTISDDQHDKNVKANPVAAFKISNLLTNGESVTVSFPYQAFEMYFKDPNRPDADALRIFPLRQGTSQKQYVLGRTFLQEAFLTVDYERKNFSIAQALSGASDPSASLQPILSGANGTSTGADPASTSVTSVPSGGSAFPTGAIAGIVVAVVVIAAAIAGFLLWRRRRQRRASTPSSDGKRPLEGASHDPEKVDYYGGAPASAGKEAVHGGDPAYAKGLNGKPGVSESITELPSPPAPGTDGTFSPLLAGRAGSPTYELAGDKPGPHEMDSRVISMASSNATALPIASTSAIGPSAAAGGGALDPAVESPEAPTPNSEGYPGEISYFDPNSPSSRSVVSRATSVGVNTVGGARIISTRSPRSPGGNSAGALRGHIRRQGSAGSHSTLVDDSPGRDSPRVPDSAFQSPQLRPGDFGPPPRGGSVSPLPGHSRNHSENQGGFAPPPP